MGTLRIALGQTNPTLGDFDHNNQFIRQMASSAVAAGSDLLIFGELALTGYPLEDLALNESFLHQAGLALQNLATDLSTDGHGDLPIIIGHPSEAGDSKIADSEITASKNADSEITDTEITDPETTTDPWSPESPRSYNTASLLYQGEVIELHHKQHLPNYAVFDEQRTFLPGSLNRLLQLGSTRISVIICEDLWRYEGPVAQAAQAGSEVIVVLNASPFMVDKDELRLKLLQQRSLETSAAIAYVNLVGGQDELVFDGQSMVVSAKSKLIARAKQFETELLISDIDVAEKPEYPVTQTELIILNRQARTQPELTPSIAPELDSELSEIWHALTLGLGDYVRKNGFSAVVLGLSGGIDSAVCAALAVDALGAEHVYGVSMPSQYSSGHSQDDAQDLATRTGLHYRVEPIADLVKPVESQLQLQGVAAENLQARIRGLILMGISNTESQLVLTTGNKTEIAVGYSTIYGDSIGAYAPLKDIVKSRVWELARWRNLQADDLGLTPPIPESSIDKPPSAELRPDQTDQDSLPEYPILDAIVEALVEQRLGVEETAALGFDPAVVQRVQHLINRSEWKRHQATLGPKVTALAFGKDRRLPITNAFEG